MRTVKFASLVIAASAVLFACKPKEETPVAESMDDSCMKLKLDRRSCYSVKRLDGNWWLYRKEFH